MAAEALECVRHPMDLVPPASKTSNKANHAAVTDEELADAGVDFLHEQALKYEFCPSLNGSNQSNKKCSCMTIFTAGMSEDNANDGSSPLTRSVANWMVFWCRSSAAVQSATVLEWCRCAEQGKLYRLPLLANEEDSKLLEGAVIPTVCRFALQQITNKKRVYFQTRMKAVANHTVPQHGLTGKRGNRAAYFDKEISDDLHLYFHQLKEFGEPVVTRFVREKTGNTEVQDSADDCNLPSHWSMRGTYIRWCEERGWKVSFSLTGKMSKEAIKWRNDDADSSAGNDDDDPMPICTWSSFFNFWKKNYPEVKITKPAEDICDLCYVFYNQTRFGQRRKNDGDDDDDDNDDDAGDKDDNLIADIGDIAGVEVDRFAPDKKTIQTEEAIALASKHVEDAKVMRRFANDKVEEAKADFASNQPWDRCRDVFVADFCQNLALPQLGRQLVGETYYYSPLGVYCFGVVDVRMEKEVMNAYMFHEGEAKKGGNTVASLLFKNLKEKGLLDKTKGPRAELSIIMDNCSGQNKNQIVLRLATLLAELGYYKKVNCIFFIVGHTKNVADRLLNEVKLQCRGKNVFTMEQLLEVCAVSDQVIPVRVQVPGDIRDFDAYEDRIYKRLPTGAVKTNHFFSAEHRFAGYMMVKETAAAADYNVHVIRKNKLDRHGLLSKLEAELPVVPAVGTCAIKQVEMYKKWRKYVPVPLQTDLYKHPGKEIMDKIASERRAKQQKKRAAKRKDPPKDITVKPAASADDDMDTV
jgi:hypothetical protein